jgi:hypothetical protein
MIVVWIEALKCKLNNVYAEQVSQQQNFQEKARFYPK